MSALIRRFTGKGQNAALSGGALLFISTTFVNAGNYVYNLILGRWLGPAAFADLSLIVTFLLVLSFITTTLSMATARFSAAYTAANAPEQVAGLRHWAGRYAWAGGVLLAVLLALGAPALATFFNMADAAPFLILAVGLPVYLAQSIDRGILQGQLRLSTLALSYQAEMWVRLLAAIVLVAVGLAVNGAVFGITLSFVATWLVARQARARLPETGNLDSAQRRTILLYSGSVVVGLVGQILINNSDVLIVKRFFTPEEAGHYAALALIGRMVFFATWSVAMTMFPIVAQKHATGEPHRKYLAYALGIVGGISGAILLATLLLPEFIVGVLFGSDYLSIAPLLALYAVATTLYTLANVVISYRLSLGQGKGAWFAAVAGIAQVVLLWLVHGSLREVVLLQIGVMTVLFVVLLVWDFALSRRDRQAVAPA